MTSGATDDLRQATDMARHMVMQCGLNDAIGPVYVQDQKLLSEHSKQAVDTEVGVRGLTSRTSWVGVHWLHWWALLLR